MSYDRYNYKFYGKGLALSGNNLQIQSGLLNAFKFSTSTIVDITTLDASSWYAVGMNEITGAFSAFKLTGNGVFDNWTITGNQLNALSRYNGGLGYVRDTVSSVGYRITDMFYLDGAKALTYVIPIPDRPKDYVFCNSNTAESVANGGHRVNFEDIVIDVNSNVTVGASWKFEPSIFARYNVSTTVLLAPDNNWLQGSLCFGSLFDNATSLKTIDFKEIQTAFAGHILSISGSCTVTGLPTQDLNINFFQDTVGAIATASDPLNKWVEIAQISD
jgi:hypothetical protein